MRPTKGFTLAELLAVIAIMLFLMVAAFGVYGTLAQRMGPDNAVSTVQAMLNGARDYAVSGISYTTSSGTGVITSNYVEVEFKTDPNNILDGTVMRMKYFDTRLPAPAWVIIPGTIPVPLHYQMVVGNGMPGASDNMPAVPTGIGNSQAPTQADIDKWKKYETDCLAAVETWAKKGGNVLAPVPTTFSVVFDPAGGLAAYDGAGNVVPPVYALTILQVGENRVVGYAFYPLNSISGTRIIFD